MFKSEFTQDFIWRMFQIFSKQGVVLFTTALVAYMLTEKEFGIFSYATVIIITVAMFSDFGISTTITKFVSENRILRNRELDRILFNSGILVLTISVVFVFVVVMFREYLFNLELIYILLCIPSVLLYPVTSLLDGYYRGMRRFKDLSIVTFVCSIVGLVATIILTMEYGLIGAIISQSIFYVVLCIALLKGVSFLREYDSSLIYRIAILSFYYGLAVVGNYLFIRFGIMLMGYYGYITELGIYELMNKLFSLYQLPFALYGQVLAISTAEDAARGEYKKIYKNLILQTWIFTSLAIAMAIFMYFSTYFIFSIFGGKYSTDTFFLMLPYLVIIYTFNIAAVSIDSGIVIPAGFAKTMALIYLPLGFFACVMSFFFIQSYGYIGILYSFVLSSFLMVFLLRLAVIIQLRSIAYKQF